MLLDYHELDLSGRISVRVNLKEADTPLVFASHKWAPLLNCILDNKLEWRAELMRANSDVRCSPRPNSRLDNNSTVKTQLNRVNQSPATRFHAYEISAQIVIQRQMLSM